MHFVVKCSNKMKINASVNMRNEQSIYEWVINEGEKDVEKNNSR